MKMEAIRTQHLRHLGRSPTHIDHETNHELRTRLAMPSLTSILSHRRLQFLQRVWKDPKSHFAVIAAAFGRPTWEVGEGPNISASKHLQLWLEDLKSLQKHIKPENIYPGEVNLSVECLNWLASLAKTDLAMLKEPFSSADRSRTTKKFGPTNFPRFTCPLCPKAFDTVSKLNAHKYKSHKIRHPIRKLVSTNICPFCARHLKNKRTAQGHAQICAQRASPAVIAAVERLGRLQADVAAPSNQRTLTQLVHVQQQIPHVLATAKAKAKGRAQAKARQVQLICAAEDSDESSTADYNQPMLPQPNTIAEALCPFAQALCPFAQATATQSANSSMEPRLFNSPTLPPRNQPSSSSSRPPAASFPPIPPIPASVPNTPRDILPASKARATARARVAEAKAKAKAANVSPPSAPT